MDVEGSDQRNRQHRQLLDRSDQKVEKRHRGNLDSLLRCFDVKKASIDKGTGLVSIIAADEGKRLIVRDENNDVLLHDRPVLPNDDSYRLQVWEDVGCSTQSKLVSFYTFVFNQHLTFGLEKDCALSFQDAESAQEIFSELCTLLRNDGLSEILRCWEARRVVGSEATDMLSC
eukprot:s914_g3.t1